jgi:hypothetical protein
MDLEQLSALAHAAEDLSLPDPLESAEGDTVETPEDWQQKRRLEILELFREHVYGRSPDAPEQMHFDVFDENRRYLSGRAVRKQIAIHVASGEKSLRIDLLVFLPSSARYKPVPVFVLLNFGGNHTVHPDAAIVLPKSYVSEKYSPPAAFRGAKSSRYPIGNILARGYGLATAYYGDIDPDFPDGFKNGVHPLFDPPGNRPPDAWGAVGAWAWGLSRIMDYFETDREIDHTKVAVAGHSRLGKTSLWAGAQDERFALVISNDSGCSGAALARRRQGETVKAINDRFPHWFCDNYKRYNDKESELPVDQHMLIASIAPRPVYVASATDDKWADPEGEFSSCVHAEPVYGLFGLTGLNVREMPEPDQPLSDGHIGYHIRTGEHDLTEYDWKCYLDFADRHLRTKNGQQDASADADKLRC